MKYILIIVAILLIFFSFNNKETHIKTLTPQDSILAFGDSLTYGYNANQGESYPAVLNRLSGLNVINAGIPAESSKDGLRRLAKLLEDKRIKLMILFFGGNDMIQGLSTEGLKKNLKTMIHMAKQKQIEVLLITVPNLSFFGFSPLELYEEVAEEENIPLLSGVLTDILSQPLLKSDQVHPNALGYKKMADEIYNSLEENGWV